jgi:hypothetical protein
VPGAAKTSKLAELRAKTDRDLAKIIENQLERALRFARGAGEQLPPKDRDSAKPSPARAEEMCAEAQVWLTKVENPGSRRRLETKWKQVRQNLNRLAHTKGRTYASACC